MRIIYNLSLIIFLSSCSKGYFEDKETKIDSVNDVRKAAFEKGNKNDLHMRYTQVRNTALMLGAQSGLAHRAGQINSFLKTKSDLLDRSFNFNHLVLRDNILPPVLVESRDRINQHSSTILTFSDRNYYIHRQAEFITNVPTWREYLLVDFAEPDKPNASTLPQNKQEKEIWYYYANEGWVAGLNQAEDIFQANLSRLKRDFIGMIKYRDLLSQNMVSMPYTNMVDLGITGNSNELNINEKILTITSLPSLQLDSSHWRTHISFLED